MGSRDQLNSYLKLIEKRLRTGVVLRGAASLTSAALILTVFLVLITNALGFSSLSLGVARLILFVALVVLLGVSLAIPVLKLSRRRAANRAEEAVPGFQQRLVTLAERPADARDPFLDLLAADTLKLARDSQPERLVPPGPMRASLAGCGVSLGLLVWMITAGPGFLGYGSARLWTGARHGTTSFYDIRVSPGDATLRRHGNQMVTAQLMGFQNANVRLYARYHSASQWTQVAMQPQPGASGFQFLFAGLPEDVEYYVAAGPLESHHFNLHVIDLPTIQRIRVTYHFPAWTGLPAAVEEQGGDLRAVAGTEAGLELFTDRPLPKGMLALDNGREISLSGGQGNQYTGTVPIEKDGLYHIAMVEQQQRVRVSDDYFIEAREARAPEVRITRPGGDYRATPIEEVTVGVSAQGDYALRGVDLHYAVNGGPDHAVSLLKQPGARASNGSSTISLENFKLVPGDVVSFYATAKDARAESRTDMYFIQADPFDREFSQSQIAGGGGGGMGGDNFQISQREKEIIAATWKQQGNRSAAAQDAADTSKLLSEVQTKLRTQTLALAGRMRAHGPSVENEEINGFQKDMKAAAEAMAPAADNLRQQKWHEALPPEQKALQHLLQAEATFRRIEVAFGNGGAGGGGAGSGRDLANLMDLELDTQKNQYETEQAANSGNRRSQAIDDALRKLDELAHREQELANRQSQQQDFQQRWQQEMLRREAEKLQQQLEQMAQGRQQSGSQSGAQGGNGQSQQAPQQRLDRALEQLRRASDDMRRAAAPGQSQADARRAAERLQEALNQLGGLRQQAASERLDSLAREAGRLQREHREQVDRAAQAFGRSGHGDTQGQRQTQAGGEEQKQLAEDRSRLARDLSRLQGEMGAAQRELDAGERGAADKLGEALEQMDKSRLPSNVQRSAEAMRQGQMPDPKSEASIDSGMGRLNEQLRQAQQALSGQKPDVQAALDRVERLREQMNALPRNSSASSGTSSQANGEGPGGQRTQADALGREPGGSPGVESGSGQAATSPQAAVGQALRELNGLRQDVRTDPASRADVDALIHDLDRLGYRTYSGNPALVEQLRSHVLSGIDKIELQLRLQLDGAQAGQVRAADSQRVPEGYQGAVAEYFRKLSKGR